MLPHFKLTSSYMDKILKGSGCIERDGENGKTVRVFDPEHFRRHQIAALHWRLSKLKPKRYY
jgi:hypothetical protein